MVEYPSLKIPAAIKAAISIIFGSEFKCFGAKRQIVELKLSLEFCVCPSKHLVKNSSFDSSS